MTHNELQNNSSNTGTKVPMTHDELLAKVDEQITTWSSEEYGWPKQWLSDEVKSKTPMASYFKALRAVVELHKPTPEPVFVSELECKICDSSYPCFTIQAIEKELS